MEMCPMASMCKGMAQRPRSGLLLSIPGLLFVLGGVFIFIEPRAVVWLLAGTSISVGVVMLFVAMLLRTTSTQFTNAGR